MSVHLVVIEKDNTYTFYSGRTKVVKVQSKEAMPLEYLEAYRRDHKLLQKDLIGAPMEPDLA